MHLKVYREDLEPDSQEMPCRLVEFKHFKPEVQHAIALVGKATFFVNEGTRLENYSVIHAPKETV